MNGVFSLEALVLNDGSEIAVPEDGVLALVGPNNAGKSLALRDVFRRLEGDNPTKVVVGVRSKKLGDGAALRKWLDGQCHRHEREGVLDYVRGGHALRAENAESWWNQQSEHLHGITPIICKVLGAAERLLLVDSVQSFDARSEAPTTALHTLYVRPDLEDNLAKASREAFGASVVVDRFGGSRINLLYGEPPAAPGSVPPSVEYLNALDDLPTVSDQGDGIKSFLGVMLGLTAERWPVTLIDEPEAFLHPPQANLLGRKLAARTGDGVQTIVATHSADVLQGLLASPDTRLAVARITRDGDRNPVKLLNPEQVKALWEDPLLRYSRVLDGLFHRAVVVCESDSDCRFYAAVLDELPGLTSGQSGDVLFTHCGGKQRIPTVVRALADVGVTVRVIADLDVLREDANLSEIVTSLGGDYAEIVGRANVIRAAVDQTAGYPSVTYVKEEIVKVLDAAPAGAITRTTADAVRGVMQAPGGWRAVKRGGVGALPQGDASAAGAAILGQLREIGLFAVDVGELERWAPTIGLHGPAWCTEALSHNRHRDEGPRQFIRILAESIGLTSPV